MAASGHFATAPPGGLPQGARRSHALETVHSHLSSQPSLFILDLGGINQPNLDFVTGLGHRLYADDLVLNFDGFFTAKEITERQFPPDRIQAFLDSAFDIPDQSVDGALVWDALQFLPLPVSEAVIERLHRVLAPDSLMLAYFLPDTGGMKAVRQGWRILESKLLQMLPRGATRPVQVHTARSIEKLFHRFQSVKFFMTRDSIQEVVVRR